MNVESFWRGIIKLEPRNWSNWLPDSTVKLQPQSMRLDPLLDRSLLSPQRQEPALPARQELRQILTTQIPSPDQPFTRVYGPLFENFQTETRARASQIDALNRSRKEALTQYLVLKNTDRERALESFWKELSMVWLMKATLLKRWNDRGIRKWALEDLKDLNYSLSKTLRPLVPADRKEWLLTQGNFYSWFNPSAELQSRVFETLSGISFQEESFDSWISALMPLIGVKESYDFHLLKSLFSAMDLPSPIRQAFSPTLRSSLLLRAFPTATQWVGLENSPFLILIAECMKLWTQPESPPLWEIGSGVDWLKNPNQMGLRLGSPKGQTKDKILEIESFDLAVVFEEEAVRANGKSILSQKLKQELENGAFSKSLKNTNVSEGTLQALLAMNRLRPGGTLLWFRDEALNADEPMDCLKELLGKGLLTKEWDFSDVEIGFHTDSRAMPKYLYAFKREIQIEVRRQHRPERIKAKAHLRSHIEVPYFFIDVFQNSSAAISDQQRRWEIHRFLSPTPQSDWEIQWPEPACVQASTRISRLLQDSIPLGNYVTIRAIGVERPTQTLDLFQAATVPEMIPMHSQQTLWLSVETDQNSQYLVVERTPPEDRKHQGFLLTVPGAAWVPSLQYYLSSRAVQDWLNHHVEQKNGRWLLKEAHLKQIPIPRSLFDVLSGVPLAPLSPAIEMLLKNLIFQPEPVLEWSKSVHSPHEKMRVFHQVSLILADHDRCLTPYLESIKPDGTFRWKSLLKLMQPSELLPWHLHPEVRVSGSLPAHFPITRVDAVQTPFEGILLTTESGFSVGIQVLGARTLYEILVDQLRETRHPTWTELTEMVKLPRNIERATFTAHDVFRCVSEQSKLSEKLQQILIHCLEWGTA